MGWMYEMLYFRAKNWINKKYTIFAFWRENLVHGSVTQSEYGKSSV